MNTRVVDSAKNLQKQKGLGLDQALIEKGLIKEEDYLLAMVEELDIPFIRLSKYTFDPAIRETVPESIARH